MTGVFIPIDCVLHVRCLVTGHVGLAWTPSGAGLSGPTVAGRGQLSGRKGPIMALRPLADRQGH